ncbi:Thiol:disulfide interchange protein DsbA [Burkholderiales bacterium]|nr:Thiol:disulfide interchange protein DsbA [Burkholderiales bacterium]
MTVPFTLPGFRGAARLALAFAAAFAIATPASAQIAEGKEYMRFKTPHAVETGKKIEVIEFFSYGCPHCADLEPHLDAWLKRLPGDVQFRRVPVAFQPAWESLGRVYYTLEALGEDAKLSPDVFTAIHGSSRTNLAQEQRFLDWAASKGLDRKKVEDTYRSFGIAGKLGRAKQVAQAYNIQSVPTLVVDGKFLLTSNSAGGHPRVPAALDAAIAVARAERPK